MTPEEQAGFRAFLKLRDLAQGDSEELFEALVAVLVWETRERRSPGKTNDTILDKVADCTVVRMGVLLHLATVDVRYYRLARRISARTLVRHDPLPLLYRQMAAALLDSDPPFKTKTYVARDALLVLAIAVGQTMGWHPTQAPGTITASRSGCARLAELLAPERANLSYDAIAKVWTRRMDKLAAAGFAAEQVSELFVAICPMTGEPD